MRIRRITLLGVIILVGVGLGAGHAGAVGTRGIRVTALDGSSGEQKEIKLYNKSYAVIIGIDQYNDLKYDQQLSYAVRDAKGVEEVLKKNFKFDKIITLYNEEAAKDIIMKVLSGDTKEDIVRELSGKTKENLMKKLKRSGDLSELSNDDSLFVFWAGHGHTQKTKHGYLGYLLPFDGSFEKSELYKNISMTMIKNDISKLIPAKHVFFVFDACYSGLLVVRGETARQTKRDFAYLKEITKEDVRQVLTAGSKYQQVLDGGPKGHSVFTGRFIELLESADDFITATEVSTSVKEKVFSDARARNHTQTPKYGALFGLGDYVFVPSLEQKVEDTKGKVAELQKEMERLDALEKAAVKAGKAREKRRAELAKRAIQAKLKAEQLRQQALEENRRKIEQEEKKRRGEEKERRAREVELAEGKKEEEKRLAFLIEKVKGKRQLMGSTTFSSLSPKATITEMREIDDKIKEIGMDFCKELADSKRKIFVRYDKVFNRYDKMLKKIRQEKQDEFETEQEFKARIAKKEMEVENERSATEKDKMDELRVLKQKIKGEYKKQSTPFIQTLKKLSRSEFTLTSDNLVLEVSRYNPSYNTFSVVIRARQSIKGIMIAANTDIQIPRQDARTFKRHFQNNILRPELSGHFDSLKSFLKTRAYIIDDATGKQYDLFNPRGKYSSLLHSEYDMERKYVLSEGHCLDWCYIAYDNGVVYDRGTGLEWYVVGPDRDTNWNEAKSRVENLSVDGVGWRMPTRQELKSLYRKGVGNRNMTPLLKTTGWWVWSGETEGSSAAWGFNFLLGYDYWLNRPTSTDSRVCAVRSHSK